MTVSLKAHSYATETSDIQDILSHAACLVAHKAGRFTPIRKHI